MNLHSKPFLSICIPTYNRGEKVFELIKCILKYTGTDIEVVVLDNCSTDRTKLLLNKIEDYRFNFVSNYSNIGGILNSLKVITLAKGEYSILCLDKDFIDYKEITNLINNLKSDNNIVFGYCNLNLQNFTGDKIFEKGFLSVLNMAYSSKHPSGYFYKTDIFKTSKILQQIFETNNNFGFCFELINVDMSFKGKSKIIDIPLITTENRHDCAKVPSFTYNKNSLYFNPQGRIIEYGIYMRNASNLDFTNYEKTKIIKSLFIRGLSASTIEYKTILADSYLCLHHGIEPRKISIVELIKIDFEFSLSFFRKNLAISHSRKFIIIFLTHLRGIIFILKNKFGMNTN